MSLIPTSDNAEDLSKYDPGYLTGCNTPALTFVSLIITGLVQTQTYNSFTGVVYKELISQWETIKVRYYTQGSRLRRPSMLNTRYFRFGRKFWLSVRPSGRDFYEENISALEANFNWQEA